MSCCPNLYFEISSSTGAGVGSASAGKQFKFCVESVQKENVADSRDLNLRQSSLQPLSKSQAENLLQDIGDIDYSQILCDYEEAKQSAVQPIQNQNMTYNYQLNQGPFSCLQLLCSQDKTLL